MYLGAPVRFRSSRSYLNRQLPAVFRIVREHARMHARNKISNADRIHGRRTAVPNRVRERTILIHNRFLPISRSQFVDESR